MLPRAQQARSAASLFQSSPAPRCGCCVEIELLACALKCGFNPHPHRGAGAADGHNQASPWWRVSILTRTEVRVLRNTCSPRVHAEIVSILTRTEVRVLQAATPPLSSSTLFQSSPAPRCGCCALALHITAHRLGCFNPHPHRGAGAALGTGIRITSGFEFQSSPAPRCGCCEPQKDGGSKQPQFQSSPAPRCGCCC